MKGPVEHFYLDSNMDKTYSESTIQRQLKIIEKLDNSTKKFKIVVGKQIHGGRRKDTVMRNHVMKS